MSVIKEPAGVMNILVTLDQNYVPPLRVMLKSLFNNNPGETFKIYMMHTDIPDEECAKTDSFCRAHGSSLECVRISDEAFSDAPVFRHYTKAMYYRLLAFQLLPGDIGKILYLDPDILVLNGVRPFYDLDIEDYLYAGATHSAFVGITKYVNQIRLGNTDLAEYFNSGVMMMNLEKQREEISEQEIFDYVKEYENVLILPDQDVINALYGKKIRPVDDTVYNYDARLYTIYNLLSGGRQDLDWVMQNTVFLHFCGKSKPWHKASANKFAPLYKHYMVLTERDCSEY